MPSVTSMTQRPVASCQITQGSRKAPSPGLSITGLDGSRSSRLSVRSAWTRHCTCCGLDGAAVAARRMTPVLGPVRDAAGVVLEEQVVGPIDMDHAVRIVHPAAARRKMQGRAEGIVDHGWTRRQFLVCPPFVPRGASGLNGRQVTIVWPAASAAAYWWTDAGANVHALTAWAAPLRVRRRTGMRATRPRSAHVAGCGRHAKSRTVVVCIAGIDVVFRLTAPNSIGQAGDAFLPVFIDIDIYSKRIVGKIGQQR